MFQVEEYIQEPTHNHPINISPQAFNPLVVHRRASDDATSIQSTSHEHESGNLNIF